MKRSIGLYAILLFCFNNSFAEQFQIPNFREAEKVFWDKVYAKGGWTLYCGERFKSRGELKMEAIYPLQWAIKHLGCNTLPECRGNAKFNRIESDLHNYYPAVEITTRARNDYKYGNIPGEFREFFECNFEVDGGEQIIEPRPVARGNIARAMFYMMDEYELPLDPSQIKLLKEWNREDPPSKDENRRNDLIEELQGTRNIFIDNPNRVNKLID